MTRIAMLIVGLALLVGVACPARAGDDAGPAKEGLIRVYVSDSKGVAIGGDDAIVTVELDYGGFKKSLTTEAKAAKKPAAPAAKKDDDKAREPEVHGGQAVTKDVYLVEMVVEPLDDPTHGASPWFETKAPFVAYQDAMKDAAPVEEPGKCKVCGMTLVAQPASFTGVVVVKLKDRTVTVSGFTYPPADAPKTLDAAATDIAHRFDEIEKFLAAGNLADVRKAAEKVLASARLLDRIAPAAAREKVADIRRRLFGIDVATVAEKPDFVKMAMPLCRMALADLKALATSK